MIVSANLGRFWFGRSIIRAIDSHCDNQCLIDRWTFLILSIRSNRSSTTLSWSSWQEKRQERTMGLTRNFVQCVCTRSSCNVFQKSQWRKSMWHDNYMKKTNFILSSLDFRHTHFLIFFNNGFSNAIGFIVCQMFLKLPMTDSYFDWSFRQSKVNISPPMHISQHIYRG